MLDINHLLKSAEYLWVMIKKSNIGTASDQPDQLKTEFPLAEKDEQANCIARMQKLQNEALKSWRALKKKLK
jgi:hypothetical protein